MINFSFCILVFGAVQVLIFLQSNKAMGILSPSNRGRLLKMDVAPFKTMCLMKPNVYFALLFEFVFRGCLVFTLKVV